MIDIHSHILPGLDDGSHSLEESLQMLKLAAESGTTDIVATPHASPDYPFNAAAVQSAFEQLSKASAGIINLHPGCDFHLSFDNLHDALRTPAKYTINGERYLLVELPNFISISIMRDALQKLIDANISPVITHPERNISLQAKPRDLHDWVKDGCFLQVTGQSFLGKFGRNAQRAAETLMAANLVHFIASDAHDCIKRPPDLAPVRDYITSRYGAATAEKLLVINPGAALSGKPIDPPLPAGRGLLRSLAFWR